MRLLVDHRTTYRFSPPLGRLTQMLRIGPEDHHDQSVTSWSVHVDCDARMRGGRDGFGNPVTMLYVEGPLARLDLHVTGEVLTTASDGVVRGTAEPLPPPVFLRTTPLTEADAAIADFAADAAAGAGDLIARLHALNIAVHERFAVDHAVAASSRSAAEAFALGVLPPRDLAHILIAAARGLAVPARYIAGYHAGAGESRAVPHGWAEAFVEGLGWVAFDPCTGLCAGEAYVRVAAALDEAGAAPVAGSRLGVPEDADAAAADPSGAQ